MLQQLLVKLTEVTLSMAAAAAPQQKPASHKALSSVIDPYLHGGAAVSVKEYRDFNGVVEINL